MTAIQPGDRVKASEDARKEVTCDHIDDIAGKTVHVVEVNKTKAGFEAFVVADPLNKEGSFIPLELLQRID